MGYVPTALATPDSEIYIRIRNKILKRKWVKMPFYKSNQEQVQRQEQLQI